MRRLLLTRRNQNTLSIVLITPFKQNQNRSNRLLHSYALKGGSVEAVWLFHRHGDRSPCRPLCPENEIETEAAFWEKKLPDASMIQSLRDRFPVDVHESHGEDHLDVCRKPFGFLTMKGMDQMKKAGSRYNLRYGARIRTAATGSSQSFHGYDFMDQWDVKVFSTNYLRTVTSAQCFLDGLLGQNKNNSRNDIFVKVRNRKNDTLNAFDKDPEFMMKLVTEVVEQPHFQTRDAVAAPIAARLANALPGLMHKGHHAYGGPSGINWIHATDHFVCRKSHGVSYVSLEPQDGVERGEGRDLAELALPALSHLSWRFRQWYKSPPLLAAISVPPLREVEKQLLHVPALPSFHRRPFTIYSCHDVSILALLYALGAEVVQNENSTYWPAYATTLAIELVKVDSKDTKDSYIVRILLSGEPIRVGGGAQSNNNGILSIDEFSSIINDLERASWSEENITGKTGETNSIKTRKDAMAGWTG